MPIGEPITERMALVVKGREYHNWKSCRVTLTVDSPFAEFQFSTAEPIDRWFDLDDFKIRPGDECVVIIGGIPRIHGIVEIREAFYDAHSHGVMFYGRDFNQHAYESSVRMDGGEVQFQNAPFSQIVNRALMGTGTQLSMQGDDSTIFPNFSISFGETPWHVAERLKRYIPGLVINSDGNHTWEAVSSVNESGGTFVEGENILSCRAVIDARQRIEWSQVKGQRPNRDEVSPQAAAEVEGNAHDGSVEGQRFTGSVAEDPATEKMANGKAEKELQLRAMDTVHATVEVYSWFEAPGRLFDIWRWYKLHSPMAGVDNYQLWSRVVVMEQSEKGSTSTIELATIDAINSGFFRGGPMLNVGPSNNFGGQGYQRGDFLP